ncbi:MAG TPA: NYN domain-containing protein [Candidatus Limnocylindrales bacterium]
MSKNVAVFVDVANIFYAAKAGGVDIDYVTLLKSATAGRDFVRAYAYTGLDPENENQRQFHAFLARSGYKVVSKDIRKYGDGRIKANLDIELVVDMMRLARNLDIAVVVSGDGDFAPAIRAVQEMGVRVEVISFRGNTSSDLIEAADQFTDIAQIARVDKTSGRSGRRVAAEGDLSMTAVPEKETEGAPRRRRGRAAAERAERTERAAGRAAEGEAAAGGLPGNLIVLPGERLSRAPEEDEEAAAEGGPAAALAEDGEAGETRRRRRRGGRGRGRGRRAEGQPAEEMPAPRAAAASEEDEEEFVDVAPSQPQHAFGSVWDSQIGLPSAPLAASGYIAEPTDEDDDLDEPEVPEYLLAERRQRQRGGAAGGRRMGGRGGRGGGYQAAIERERYGRGGGGGGSFGGSRLAERPRQDRGRGRGGQRPGRPERPPMVERRPFPPPAAAASGDPWSEVPADLEEMLRAELARKIDRREPDGAPAATADQPPSADGASGEPAAAAPAKAPRARATRAPAEAKPKRTSRAKAATAAEAEVAEGGTADAEKPKRATRARTAKSTSAKPAASSRVASPKAADAGSAEASTDGAAPAKPRTRRKKADAPAGDEAASEG